MDSIRNDSDVTYNKCAPRTLIPNIQVRTILYLKIKKKKRQ